jgi:carbonic anhydrase/acetyltransferase-like protein (isoleucine patch superfamily)
MALLRIGEHQPRIGAGAWVADNARLIGQVELGAESSVWYGSTIRADNELIRIGARCNIQDGAVLHTDPGFPMLLGDEVTVGHQAMLHGCVVGAGSLIGIQTVVLNGARIGSHCLVGAGSLVTEGKEFPDGALIMGRPAKVVRMLEPAQIEGLRTSALQYVQQAARHRLTQRVD